MTTFNSGGPSIPNLTNVVQAALDLVRAGVVVTDINGRVLIANRAAEAILAAGDGLGVTENSELLLSQQDIPLPVSAILTREGSQPRSAEDRSVMCVERPSGKLPLTVIVRPTTSYEEGQNAGIAAALVFIQDPEAPVCLPHLDLREHYGLTYMEASIANFLMEGGTLEECCERLAIKPSTARMHMRSLFNKTGTRGQGELVALLFRNHRLASGTHGVSEAGARRRVPAYLRKRVVTWG